MITGLPPGHETLWSLLFAALLAFAIYRRFRRNFGRQPLSARRLAWRIAILSAVGAVVLPTALRSAAFLSAALGGLILGVGLGVWGARRSRFERRDDKLYYIPHTFTGLAVFTLFLGRIAYRLFTGPVGPSAPAAPAVATSNPGSLVQSPITLGLLLILVGYYVYYYAAILIKSRHIEPADLEPAANSPG
jgi:hypothetical protein